MTDPAAAREAPSAPAAKDLLPVAGMAGLFLLSIGLAMAIAPTYVEQDVRAFEDPEDVQNPLIYLAIVIAFTAVILYIARKGMRKVIRGIILFAVFMTTLYVFWPILNVTPLGGLGVVVPGLGVIGLPDLIGFVLGVGLVSILYWYPEWYVIDIAGVIVSAGAAAIFGISFGLLPALILLVAFAIYDAIAVYRTKHMIDLADSVLELRLPIMFVVPKSRGYSFLEETKRLKEKLDTGEEREAMFMGLGDAVIPAVLVVSALQFLDPAAAVGVLGLSAPLVVSLATLLGSLLGYVALMWFVMKGNPQAGLPLLNGGAIVGFFLALLPLYGIAPLVPG